MAAIKKKTMAQGQVTQYKGVLTFRPFKSSIRGLKYNVFKNGAVTHDTKLMKTAEAIADYVQINFN